MWTILHKCQIYINILKYKCTYVFFTIQNTYICVCVCVYMCTYVRRKCGGKHGGEVHYYQDGQREMTAVAKAAKALGAKGFDAEVSNCRVCILLSYIPSFMYGIYIYIMYILYVWYMYIYIHVYIYVYTYIHTRLFIYLHICTCVCTHIHIYTGMCTGGWRRWPREVHLVLCSLLQNIVSFTGLFCKRDL